MTEMAQLYTPKVHGMASEDDPLTLASVCVRQHITQQPFGILVSVVQTGSKSCTYTTHIPFILDSSGCLVGHLAANNPHTVTMDYESQSRTAHKVIFPGPHGYVSPSLYEKADVPTWNYSAVHITGSLTVITGDEKMSLLAAQVNTYEQGAQTPWTLDQLQKTALVAKAKAILMFRLQPNRVEGKAKVSANKSQVTQQSVKAAFENGCPASGIKVNPDLAALMQYRVQKVP